MADRDVMTLPLRKRKLYMNDCGGDAAELENNGAKDMGQKVIRHSSVIQFAKASQEEAESFREQEKKALRAKRESDTHSWRTQKVTPQKRDEVENKDKKKLKKNTRNYN